VLTLGYASGEIPKIPANILLVKNFTVHGVFWGSYSTNNPTVFNDSVRSVIKLWTNKRVKPHVGKIFKLGQVNEAVAHVLSRQSTGKVLLDCE